MYLFTIVQKIDHLGLSCFIMDCFNTHQAVTCLQWFSYLNVTVISVLFCLISLELERSCFIIWPKLWTFVWMTWSCQELVQILHWVCKVFKPRWCTILLYSIARIISKWEAQTPQDVIVFTVQYSCFCIFSTSVVILLPVFLEYIFCFGLWVFKPIQIQL